MQRYIYLHHVTGFVSKFGRFIAKNVMWDGTTHALKRAWSDTATSWAFGPLIQFVDPGPNGPKMSQVICQFDSICPINPDKLIVSGFILGLLVFSVPLLWKSRYHSSGVITPSLFRSMSSKDTSAIAASTCSTFMAFMAPSATTSTTFYEFLNLWPTSATKESMTCWLEKDGDIACSRQFIAELKKCFTFDPKTPVVGVDLGKIWTNCLLQANVMASQPNRCCFYSGLLHSLIFSWFLRSHGWKNKDYKQGGLSMTNTSEPSP